MKILKNKLSNIKFNKKLKTHCSIDLKNIPQLLNYVHSIILIYPNNEKYRHECDSAQKLIFDYFGDLELTVIHPDLINKELISYNNLPRDLFFKSYEKKYDILIDLNYHYDLLSSYITSSLISNLKCRLYEHKKSDVLYHLSVKSDSVDIKSKIKNLVYYINCLKKENILNHAL